MMRHAAVSVFALSACAALAAPPPSKAPLSDDPSAEVTLGGVIHCVVATTAPDGTVTESGRGRTS